jgi:transketolase
MHKTPGVEMSTGSLGHGTSVGMGMALAARLAHQSFWTYVLIGDGDLNEGQTWEAIMSGAKFRPERLVVLVDYNKVQLDGPSDEVMPMDPLADKFRAFNWNVAPTVYDGHSVDAILKSFEWLNLQSAWPTVIIYRTHKGRGVSFMEDTAQWHGAVVDDVSYTKGCAELLATLEELAAKL